MSTLESPSRSAMNADAESALLVMEVAQAGLDDDAYDAHDFKMSNLVIEVRDDEIAEEIGVPSASASASKANPDEPTFLCVVHKKMRRERYLQHDPETNTHRCLDTEECKPCTAKPKKKSKNSSVTGGNSSISTASNSTSQRQQSFICSAHGKKRSARNLVHIDGRWVCAPSAQCQTNVELKPVLPPPVYGARATSQQYPSVQTLASPTLVQGSPPPPYGTHGGYATSTGIPIAQPLSQVTQPMQCMAQLLVPGPNGVMMTVLMPVQLGAGSGTVVVAPM